MDHQNSIALSTPPALAGLRKASSAHLSRALRPGLYVPTSCFFDAATEDIDVQTLTQHVIRLAQAGVSGLATQGSNGEAVHLTHSERQLVTLTTRSALDQAGFSSVPIIVGCSAQSIRESLQYCAEAKAAGGDYALLLPPHYYAPLFSAHSATITEFYTKVADVSPIPIVIYNYPGAVGGLDLSSDVIITLSSHPNIVGVKLTCGNTGKLNRIVAATKSSKSSKPVAADTPPRFLVLGGSADFTLQGLVGGAHGVLAGLGNIAPKACGEILRLWHENEWQEAQELQEIVARGDWMAIQGGVVATKAALETWLGYGGFARAPLPRPDVAEMARWRESFGELMEREARIGKLE